MYKIEPSQVQGTLTIPSSKSHTLRAILFGALAHGTSRIEDYLDSPDTHAMISAVRKFGAKVIVEKSVLTIEGFGGAPTIPDDVIDCGNSGIVLRFIGALAALTPQYTVLTGDASIRHNRPVSPLLSALKQLGAIAESTKGDNHAPILVKGPLIHSKATLDGADSQPVSALLIAGAFASHPIEIFVENPGEKPWIDLTLSWFDFLSIPYIRNGYTHYRLEGNAHLKGFTYQVPGDFSTAAFPIVAALLTNSELKIDNLNMSDSQGDKEILTVLQKMGAIFEISNRSITVKKGAKLKGMTVDINHIIDALPILSVLGCFAEGRLEITNATIARKKETDRIKAMCTELKKMGAKIQELPDGLIIEKSALTGAALETYHDHRIVMSLSIAALIAKGSSEIHGVESVTKTFPNFLQSMQAIGANIEHHPLWI